MIVAITFENDDSLYDVKRVILSVTAAGDINRTMVTPLTMHINTANVTGTVLHRQVEIA